MPPSADVILRATPVVIGLCSAAITTNWICSYREHLTDEEKEERKQEVDRRATAVSEMVDILEIAGVVIPPSMSESAAAPLDQLDDVNVQQISFSRLYEKCQSLVTMNPEAPELAVGVLFCAKLLLKELRTAAVKTSAQKDPKFADGEVLEELLYEYEVLDRLVSDAGSAVSIPSELRRDIGLATTDAWRVHRTHRLSNLVKAIKMIALARDALPSVMLKSAVSMVHASVRAAAPFYQTQVLQALQNGAVSVTLWTSIKAVLCVQLMAAALRTVENQLKQLSDEAVATSLQRVLFQSLFEKDLDWWSQMGERFTGRELVFLVMGLPRAVESALKKPQMLANNVISIAVQVGIVKQHGSRILLAILSLHWGTSILNAAVAYLKLRLDRYVNRWHVEPSRDRRSWHLALEAKNIQLFQSFDRSEKESRDFENYVLSRFKLKKLKNVVATAMEPMKAMIKTGESVTKLMGVAHVVREGVMDLVEAQNAMLLAGGLQAQLSSSYSAVTGLLEGWEMLASAYDHITIRPIVTSHHATEQSLQPARGQFVFEDVHFRYLGQRDECLKGINFSINAGEVVGITGRRGCGKSTCLRLIERFYDTTSGRILLDGRDLREYPLGWLRRQIVVVAQEPQLLPLTIRQNLIFGCSTEPSLAEIKAACIQANIWHELSNPRKYPNGLETTIKAIQNVSPGPHRCELVPGCAESVFRVLGLTGEKQLLCIARAILANPRILLLDEATSALDETSQAQVQHALDSLMRGRTTFIVAHRLSTIQSCDRILGMEDGRVLDNGTHEELLEAPSGVYKTLWTEAQKKSNTD